jgi:hypothetical protein
MRDSSPVIRHDVDFMVEQWTDVACGTGEIPLGTGILIDAAGAGHVMLGTGTAARLLRITEVRL